MKKNFLLGLTAMFLAGVRLGGVVKAEDELVWEYVYNAESWNASYTNGGLKVYYEWADAASPYKEDLWNTVEGRAANWNDIEKDGGGNPIEYEDGYHYTNCERNWSGAISAPEAKYPWAVLTLPKPFLGVVKFVYHGTNGDITAFPYGESARVFNNGFGAVSIPATLGEEFLLDENGNTTFDSTKLDIILIPSEQTLQVHCADNYVYNSTSQKCGKKVEPSGNNSSGGGGGGGGGSSKPTTNKVTDATTGDDSNVSTGSTVATGDKNVEKDNNLDSENANEPQVVSYDPSLPDDRQLLTDGLTPELHNAYEFAHKNGITTTDSAIEANMYGPLTRIAMAKMLSQYAINVLGKKPANVVVPSFPDVSEELDAEYSNGVTLAYQLGIMGINIEEFRPFDVVTRAEFATALSRMLFGLSDGENLYYETHMQKLIEEKIITIADPNMRELRGYVMIMLMRSSENN